MTDALVVLSGGQDSTTCLYWAKENFNGKIHAITFNYGQRHQREIEAAVKIAKMAEVASHEVVTLGDDILKSTSPLTDPSLTLEQYPDHDTMEKIIGNRIEKTFVPMRNALFMTLAANRAVDHNLRHIVTGVCQADNANYPDCTRLFIEAQELTINVALGFNHELHIRTPLMDKAKSESVHLALTLGGCYTALAYSHTAYDGSYPPTGADHATVLRAHGFEQANIPDPLIVRAAWERHIPFPDTSNYRDWEYLINQVFITHGNKIDDALHALENELIVATNGSKRL